MEAEIKIWHSQKMREKSLRGRSTPGTRHVVFVRACVVAIIGCRRRCFGSHLYACTALFVSVQCAVDSSRLTVLTAPTNSSSTSSRSLYSLMRVRTNTPSVNVRKSGPVVHEFTAISCHLRRAPKLIPSDMRDKFRTSVVVC